ncbi:MAG: hypothetical protein K0R68_3378 [Mycobacterium sp.]|nr:hypothetical protein [Mycobacterium sp.]
MTVMTAEQLAARSRRAVAAALEVARGLGLPVEHGEVLHDVFSVVVHLTPVPVVARIQVVVPPGLSAHERLRRQQRELDVVAWLDQQGVAVVAPSPLVPRFPVVHNGFGMTFWDLADVSDDHTPYAGYGVQRTAQLNAALVNYPDPLPFLAPFNTGTAEMLAQLTAADLLTADDLSRARTEYDALHEVLRDDASFRARFPAVDVQPIHGDGPSHNMIQTHSGLLFSDFEDITCGPVEWDLAMLGPESNADYDAAAVSLGLRATDPRVQLTMDRARTLQFIGCVALIPELPILAEGLAPTIAAWRSSPAFA